MAESPADQMAARISRAESALMAAVLAFERYSGPITRLDPISTPSVEVPVSTVERWRIIAEGGE